MSKIFGNTTATPMRISGNGVDSGNYYTKDVVDEKDNAIKKELNDLYTSLEQSFHTFTSGIDEVQSIADKALTISEGANRAKCFNHYIAFVEDVNDKQSVGVFTSSDSDDYLPIGNNILIKELNVPDLWVMEYSDESGYPNYVEGVNKSPNEVDEEILNLLKTQGHFYTKWLKIGQLETQKVDLSDYCTQDEVNTAIQTAILDSWAEVLEP